MITYSKVIELPDSEPISLDEAKTHLEVQGTSKDAFITSLIKVARKKCESYAGLSLITQKRRVVLDYFPSDNMCRTIVPIILPYGPVQSIESFTYVDSNGSEQTINEGADGYSLDIHSDVARVFKLSDGSITEWPSTMTKPNVVTIEYIAGYDSVSGDTDFPDQALQAILLEVGSMFENRQNEIVGGNISELNANSMALLDDIKVYWNANC